MPWLYQKYAGHDNNRDGFALNLPESQHLGRLLYREWTPQAYVDHHQMGSGNARLYIPPYAEPIRARVTVSCWCPTALQFLARIGVLTWWSPFT